MNDKSFEVLSNHNVGSQPCLWLHIFSLDEICSVQDLQ